MDISNYIKKLDFVNDLKSSIHTFKQIYSLYKPIEWLDTDLLFNWSNLIAKYRPDLISVGIRLNVQVNLFLRTIARFGNRQMFEKVGYDLGAFGLTESNNGVLSGFYVDTDFEEQDDFFILNTNEIHKNWISQGIVAKYLLIFAKNVNNEKDVRIFLLTNEQEGIEKQRIMDIGLCNTLDLGKISLKNVRVLKEYLLEKTSDLSKSQLLNGIYYGRMMIAEAVCESIMGLLEKCDDILENNDKFKHLVHADVVTEERDKMKLLLKKMRLDRIALLDTGDVFNINIYKIVGVEESINSFTKLTKLFGTHLMKYPLKYEDLILNKVAEGDTDVLRISLINHQLKMGVMHNLIMDNVNLYSMIQIYYNNLYVLKHYKEISDKIIDSHL